MKTKVVEANIEVHTKVADVYNNEPHFRPENRAKVKKILTGLQKKTSAKKMLDIGCGTGFILDLAHDLFDELHGVDVTQAMLDKVNLSPGNITLYNSVAETLPFSNDTFDFATAYAFIHHVEDYSLIIKEAYRVLKNGGIFYVDLEPNKLFWTEMDKLEKNSDFIKYSKIIQKEIDSVLHTDEAIMEEFGISPDVVNNAEYTKSILGGIDPIEFKKVAIEIGFSEVEYEYDWFLGQGTIMHEHSFEEADAIDRYLKQVSPLADHLYKYVRIILTK